MAVNGRYLPGKTWADEGYGVLWIDDLSEVVSFVQLVESFSNADIHPLESEELLLLTELNERPGQVVYHAADFVKVVARMAAHGRGFGLSKELDLYLRLERLALKIVQNEDVVAFASPANLSHTDVYSTCFKLAQTEDDGWIQWSSHTESYASSWLPGFQSEADRSLRMLYISYADDVWRPGWRKDLGWTKRDHGRILIDAWLMLCVDVMVRSSLETPRTPGLRENSSPPSYRVMYRGEEEVLGNWKAALYQTSSIKAQFSADGWLLWRLLRTHIQGAGWHQEWLVERTGRAYYHLTFELLPPRADAASTDWRLRYFVAHNQLDIRAPLRDWWESEKRVWHIGKDVLIEPDIWLLQSLRHAGEVCRPIRDSLQTAAPSECTIPADEVFEFITAEVPRLRGQGFVTLMPEVDTDTSQLDIRVRVQVKRTKQKTQAGQSGWKKQSGLFQAEQLVEFDWNIVIEDTEISKQDFEQMVAEKTPYLQLGGSWKLIPLQAIYDQIRELNQGKLGTQASIVQLSRTALMNQVEGEDEDHHLIPIDLSFDDEALETARVMDGLFRAHQPMLLDVPEGFSGTLRDYQQRGYSWLVHLRNLSCGACLADDMGLGKTIQVLAYLQYLKVTRNVQGVHLLICPTSLLQNWRAEIARFTPDLRIHIHHGAARNGQFDASQTVLEHAMESVDIVMTTYSTLVRDIDMMRDIQWDVVISDEAQNIKNAETKQSKAICQLLANHRIALTGTPVENRLEELWAIFQFVNPGFLGSPTWFRRTFVERISVNGDARASKQLNRLLRPVLMRRRKTDPLIQMELPEKWEVREHAALTTEQAALYQSVVNRLFHGIGVTQSGMGRRGQILAALVRLKQLCDHPCLVSGGSSDAKRSGKLHLLLDLMADVVADGESALIFTQFRDMGELICDAIEEQFGWRPKFLHGGLSASARGEMVNNFQSGKDSCPVFVLSLKAGGVGLNLTRANHVFHFDRWWNPAVEDQATDRAFRIGQTKDVQVHKFVCPGTIEERIDTLITQKRILSSAVVGESEGWITELDNAALQSLFELDVNAAVEEGYD